MCLPSLSNIGVMTVISGKWVPPARGLDDVRVYQVYKIERITDSRLKRPRDVDVLHEGCVDIVRRVPCYPNEQAHAAHLQPIHHQAIQDQQCSSQHRELLTPKRAQLKSSLSLIFTDTLVFCRVNPICSAMPMKRFDMIDS